MEHQHDIESHALLGDQDFLVTVDDEVPTLIVTALSCIPHNSVLAELGQMTALRSDHNWNSSDEHFVALEESLLGLDNGRSTWVSLLLVLDFNHLDGAEDLSLIGETTDPGDVRHDRLVGLITFMEAWELVNSGPAKYYLIRCLFIFLTIVLAIIVDFLFFKLLDNLLHRVL